MQLDFNKKDWQDYQAEHPNRRKLKIISKNDDYWIVDVTREVGEIATEGDSWNASNMNDVENRVEQSFNEVGKVLGDTDTYSELGDNLAEAIMKTYNVGNNIILTQAQYDALPESQKQSDVTYYITDGEDKYYQYIFDIIAQPWNSNKIYKVGDYVIYENVYYKCVVNTSTYWNDNHWKNVNVSEEIKFVDSIKHAIYKDYNQLFTYKKGELCTKDDVLYSCILDTPSPAGVWDSSKWKQTSLAAVISELYISYYSDIQDIFTLVNLFGNFCDVWTSGCEYTNGCYVVYKNKTYRCKTTHISSSVWDDTNWEMLTPNEIFMNLKNLTTEAKSDIISAINEINEKKVEAKEMTLADYNALPESEKMNSRIAYFIPDASGEPSGKLPQEYQNMMDNIESRIKKFYCSNEGNLSLNDSDNGLIQSVKIYCVDGNRPIIRIESSSGRYNIVELNSTRLYGIQVDSGENVIINGIKYVSDYIDLENNRIVRNVNPDTNSIIPATFEAIDRFDLIKLKSLKCYYPDTLYTINGYMSFTYPVSMEKGWEYVKAQINDNRNTIYDVSIMAEDAYLESIYNSILLSEEL